MKLFSKYIWKEDQFAVSSFIWQVTSAGPQLRGPGDEALGQETAKWPLRSSSQAICYLLLPLKGRGILVK